MSEEESELRSFSKAFAENYHLVEYAFENPYEWPEMDSLRHEVCGCIAFGLNQAAMTLLNHMTESLLKYSLIYKHSIDNQKEPGPDFELVQTITAFTKEGIDKYGSQNLYQNIESAFGLGLLNEEERKTLHGIRKIFRNPYVHADKKGTFGTSSTPVAGAIIEDGNLVSRNSVEVAIADFPFIQGVAQAQFATTSAPYYFVQIDRLVRDLQVRVFGKDEENT